MKDFLFEPWFSIIPGLFYINICFTILLAWSEKYYTAKASVDELFKAEKLGDSITIDTTVVQADGKYVPNPNTSGDDSSSSSSSSEEEYEEDPMSPNSSFDVEQFMKKKNGKNNDLDEEDITDSECNNDKLDASDYFTSMFVSSMKKKHQSMAQNSHQKFSSKNAKNSKNSQNFLSPNNVPNYISKGFLEATPPSKIPEFNPNLNSNNSSFVGIKSPLLLFSAIKNSKNQKKTLRKRKKKSNKKNESDIPTFKLTFNIERPCSLYLNFSFICFNFIIIGMMLFLGAGIFWAKLSSDETTFPVVVACFLVLCSAIAFVNIHFVFVSIRLLLLLWKIMFSNLPRRESSYSTRKLKQLTILLGKIISVTAICTICVIVKFLIFIDQMLYLMSSKGKDPSFLAFTGIIVKYENIVSFFYYFGLEVVPVSLWSLVLWRKNSNSKRNSERNAEEKNFENLTEEKNENDDLSTRDDNDTLSSTYNDNYNENSKAITMNIKGYNKNGDDSDDEKIPFLTFEPGVGFQPMQNPNSLQKFQYFSFGHNQGTEDKIISLYRRPQRIEYDGTPRNDNNMHDTFPEIENSPTGQDGEIAEVDTNVYENVNVNFKIEKKQKKSSKKSKSNRPKTEKQNSDVSNDSNLSKNSNSNSGNVVIMHEKQESQSSSDLEKAQIGNVEIEGLQMDNEINESVRLPLEEFREIYNDENQ